MKIYRRTKHLIYEILPQPKRILLRYKSSFCVDIHDRQPYIFTVPISTPASREQRRGKKSNSRQSFFCLLLLIFHKFQTGWSTQLVVRGIWINFQCAGASSYITKFFFSFWEVCEVFFLVFLHFDFSLEKLVKWWSWVHRKGSFDLCTFASTYADCWVDSSYPLYAISI